MPGSEPRLRPLDALRFLGTTLRWFLEVAVVGAVAWVVWWTPPEGAAYDGEFTYVLDQVEGSVSGTATYLVVAGVAGLGAGLLTAVVHRRLPWLALGAVTVSGLVAGWVMAALGRALGPDAASDVAERSADGSTVLLDLRVEGWGAYAAMPAGAVLGVALVFLLWPSPREQGPDGVGPQRSDDGTPRLGDPSEGKTSTG